MINCDVGGGDEEVPQVGGEGGMNSRKGRDEMIFKSTNSAFSKVGAMVSRRLELCIDFMVVEEAKGGL